MITMKANTVFAALLWALSPAKGDELPQAVISRLLGPNMPITWRIDQVSYDQSGPHWQVDLYYSPQQPDPRVCLADILTLIIAKKDGSYQLEAGPQRTKGVWLGPCSGVRRFGAFANLGAGLTSTEIVKSVNAVFSAGHPQDRAITFETSHLAPLFYRLRRSDLRSVERQGRGIQLTFYSERISPDLLAIKVDSDDSLKVYVENGPDTTSRRARR